MVASASKFGEIEPEKPGRTRCGSCTDGQASVPAAKHFSRPGLSSVHLMDLPAIQGLGELWRLTRGDRGVCVAVLDGAVDLSHACFEGAALGEVLVDPTEPPGWSDGPAAQHGTHVASLVFGQPGCSAPGVAPGCRGLLIRVFRDHEGAAMPPACGQAELARALRCAVRAGAHVINISGGSFAPSGEAQAELAEAVAECAERDVLIVAAVGNEGCECLHVPGALPTVLAVGALDDRGHPLGFSNWGGIYQSQGLLAPGAGILGAVPGGGVTRRTGTSFAAPIVSGVAALLLSVQRLRNQPVSPLAVRDLLLATATPGPCLPGQCSPRWLAGRLNIPGALSMMNQGAFAMPALPSDSAQPAETAIRPLPPPGTESCEPPHGSEREAASAASPGAAPARALGIRSVTAAEAAPGTDHAACVAPSDCGCASCRGQATAAPRLVYALGSLGYDFPTEARRDSLRQQMAQMQPPGQPAPLGENANPYDAEQLLNYLDQNPWDAAAVIWTLNVEAMPAYAIAPSGPFAHVVCERLRQFLREQVQGVERMSVAGLIAGAVKLSTGHTVPVIVPELRGMYNWKSASLVAATAGPPPAPNAPAADRQAHDRKTQGLRNFLDRVYYELRNLGTSPADRAVNYAATQTFEIGAIYNRLGAPWELDRIEVERSPLCRPDSECWDVKLLFFNPESQVQSVRKVYRVTVDVSDVVPVTIGRPREWSVR